MTTHFKNLSIDPTELPALGDIEFKHIDKNYLKVSLFSSGLFFLLCLGVAVAIIYFSEFDNPQLSYIVSLGSILLLAFLNISITILAFKKKVYALRQRDIVYSKGLIWAVRTTIPFNRIQHAEIKQGPLERLYKLNSLKIYTAGGQSSDLVIPGLQEEQALSIKAFVLKKTGEDGTASA